MTNPWDNKTPEERRAIAAKGVATRRANKEREMAIREDAKQRVIGLKTEIEKLEAKLAGLQRLEIMNELSTALTTKALLGAEEIVNASMPWDNMSGVYFLVEGDEIVYVGQAVNVYARISQHALTKTFSRYAFVPCKPDMLDRLESLYIHVLRPKLNGNIHGMAKLAPIPLDELIGLSKLASHRANK